MLKRKVYSELLKWKASNTQKCLVLKGARQVGKTYIVREFGRNEYESFVEIDFLRQPEMKDIFSGDLTSTEILKRMSVYLPDYKLVPGSTLILLDEIQRCANARASLKYLAQDNRIDVIASGSLLGLKLGQDADEHVEQIPSVPVGYEQPLMMYSLDFEEYLWAMGFDEGAIAYLQEFYEAKAKVPDVINNKYIQLVCEFMVVGGMPEVVQSFATNHDFNEVQSKQEQLMEGYKEDIAQHAKRTERIKVTRCFDSIPAQLARENKKFKYSEVEKKATARKFEESIQWLIDANMVLPCYNVSTPQLPLRYNYKENEFKLYMHDTGLLMSQYGIETKRALLNGTLKGAGKGGIFENFVAESLIKKGYKLFYYKPNENSEIEFLIEKYGEIIPVEVKAGNTATKSLNSFIDKYHPCVAYKIIKGNVGKMDSKLSIPHYMALFL